MAEHAPEVVVPELEDVVVVGVVPELEGAAVVVVVVTGGDPSPEVSTTTDSGGKVMEPDERLIVAETIDGVALS